MKRIATYLLTLAALAGTGLAEAAEQYEFSYASGESRYAAGSLRAENYDVALALTDPRLEGLTVKGLKVAVVTSADITDYSVWMSRVLKVGLDGTDKVNKPDVCSVTVTPEGNVIEHTFAEPVVIPEGGLYVGYSFKSTPDTYSEEVKYPVRVVSGARPGGLWLRSSINRTRWEDRSEEFGAVADMTVILEGTLPAHSMTLESVQGINAQVNEKCEVEAVVVNTSGRQISGFGYDYTVDGREYAGTYSFETPMPAQFGRMAKVMLPVEGPQTFASETLKINLNKVDGEANADTARELECELFGVPYLPKRRVVIEEYSGTWCTNCPRGIVGMELMDEYHHGDFSPIVYHNSDAMHLRAGYPVRENKMLPGCQLDRVIDADPYSGLVSGSNFGIEKVWASRAAVFTPVDVKVEAYWDEDNPKLINVTTKLNWVKTPEDTDLSQYRIEYVVTADDLTGTGTKWTQENSYSGKADEYSHLLGFDRITQPDTYYMYGYKFQDVAILHTDCHGLEGSVDGVEAFHEQTHTYQFNTGNAVGYYGDNLVQDRSKLQVTAMVLYGASATGYGEVLNSDQTETVWEAGVAESVLGSEAVEAEYYDLQGRRLQKPSKGLVIVRERLANGSSRTRKAIFDD